MKPEIGKDIYLFKKLRNGTNEVLTNERKTFYENENIESDEKLLGNNNDKISVISSDSIVSISIISTFSWIIGGESLITHDIVDKNNDVNLIRIW